MKPKSYIENRRRGTRPRLAPNPYLALAAREPLIPSCTIALMVSKVSGDTSRGMGEGVEIGP